MKGLFKSLDKDMNYSDTLEVDGAYVFFHKQYGKSPIFNNLRATDIAPHIESNHDFNPLKDLDEDEEEDELKITRPFDSSSKCIKGEKLELFNITGLIA